MEKIKRFQQLELSSPRYNMSNEKGTVTAVSQKEKGYGITLGKDNWFNGFGTCPVKKGDEVDVTFEENEFGKSIKKVEVTKESPKQTQSTQSSGYGKSPEDQRRIVRQSSIGYAVETLKLLNEHEKEKLSTLLEASKLSELVVNVAEFYESWVYR